MKVNQSELSNIVGRSDRQIRNWLDDGCPRGEDDLYETVDVIDWMIRRNNGRASSSEQRTRLLRAQAEKAELEAARLRAELVPVDQVQKQWNRMLGAFRARTLAAPSKGAALSAAAKKSFRDQLKVWNEVIHELLTELADLKPGSDIEFAQSGDSEAATKADGKRVGRPRKKAKPRVKR